MELETARQVTSLPYPITTGYDPPVPFQPAPGQVTGTPHQGVIEEIGELRSVMGSLYPSPNHQTYFFEPRDLYTHSKPKTSTPHLLLCRRRARGSPIPSGPSRRVKRVSDTESRQAARDLAAELEALLPTLGEQRKICTRHPHPEP